MDDKYNSTPRVTEATSPSVRAHNTGDGGIAADEESGTRSAARPRRRR